MAHNAALSSPSFLEETVCNEEYYIAQEQELIKQSNLELELEELEERCIREMTWEGLLRPILVNPGENKPEDAAPKPVDPGETPF